MSNTQPNSEIPERVTLEKQKPETYFTTKIYTKIKISKQQKLY